MSAPIAAPVNDSVSAQLAAAIVNDSAQQTTDSFEHFLSALKSSTLLNRQVAVQNSISAFLKHDQLSQQQLHVVQRLLGIYTRIKYGDAAVRTLEKLVAIPTFQVAELPQYENPEFHKMADTLAALAKEFNLDFRNIDNRVYEISLQGSKDELVGIHAHADVVPVTPSLWVLEDGTKLDPFKVTRIGDRLYGRGTEDDKNGIVVTMYAMKVIKEENIPLLRHFRLLIDTTEETTSEAIPYYFERNPVPNYNLALDGGYPVVIAEKGSGAVVSNFTVRKASANKSASAEITGITGGLAVNQIPSASVATIHSSSPAPLAVKLNQWGKQFVAEHGGNFSITAEPQDNALILAVKGVSAHSSDPESGVNPVSRMFAFIKFVQQQDAVFKFNHITDAASYIASNWGLDSFGKTLGIDFSHDFMGPLTSAVTFIDLDDKTLQVAVNLRIPVGRDIEDIKQDILTKLNDWQSKSGIDVQLQVKIREPMYRNPKGPWVNALLDVATENLSMPREFGSSNGGTSVHNLPNGVQFGLAMPDEKYTGHNANEFKRIDQFLLDLQIVTEMIARVGQMPSLE